MKFMITFSKCLLVFALFCFKNEMISAQSKFKIGFKVGVNTSTLSYSTGENLKTRTSFHAGLTSVLDLTSKLALQPELLYSSQGFNIPNAGSQPYNYMVLNVPLAYKTSFVHLRMGPYLGYLMSIGGELEWTDSNGKPVDIIDFNNKFDAGITFGVQFPIKKFFLGINGSLGLIDVEKKIPNALGQAEKNRVLQASVGYYF
jgi:Outer membrane protein beta-barrel domain